MRAMIIFVLSLFITACVNGSGRLETRDLPLRDFDSVKLEDSARFELHPGEAFAVRVTTDDNLWDYLRAQTEGRQLVIGMRDGVAYEGATLRGTIAMPAVAGVAASGGAAAGWQTPLSADRLELRSDGASALVGPIAALDELLLDVSGSGRADLAGAAALARVNASGAGHVDLRDLTLEAADVTLSGASDATIAVVDSLSYDLSGSSRLVYFGTPQISSAEVSGGSTVTQR